MSRVALPSEKVMAVAGVYKALGDELGLHGLDSDVVIASLIDASVRIAMATDTRDMGVMAMPPLDEPDVPSGGPD